MLRIINIFILIFLCIFQNAQASDNPKVLDHMIVFFTNPRVIVEGGISKFESYHLSNHAIYIGNKLQINRIESLIKEILKNNLKGEGIKKRIAFRIEFVYPNGNEDTMFIDKDGNFEYKFITGKVPLKLFNDLIQICENLTYIVDFRFQQKRFLEQKGVQ